MKQNNSMRMRPFDSVELVSSPPRRAQRFFFWSKRIRKISLAFARHYSGLRQPDPDIMLELLHREIERSAFAKNPATTKRDDYFRKLRLILPAVSDDEARAINLVAKHNSIRKCLLQTAMIKFDNWMPQIDIIGNTQTETVASGQRPVIYWIDNTIFAELIGRAGLCQAGIKALHYSANVHEHGGTWLGRALLQKPIFRLEQRFVDARILSTPQTHFSSVRAFAKALHGNKAVFNMNNAYLGRRHACTPLGDDLFLVQATAPMNMARRHNALLVPVTALEVEPFKHYQVQFHEPLEPDRNLSHDDDDIRRMAYLSTQRQLRSIREAPDQWLCFVGDQIAAPEGERIDRYGM